MSKTRRRRRRLFYKIGTAWILFCALFIWLQKSNYAVSSNVKPKAAGKEFGWNLMLVNAKNSIPDDYAPYLIELSNGEKVDARIFADLQEMFDAARAQGLELFVAAGYRTWEEQRRLLDEKTQAFQYEGHSRKQAKKLALQWVALPGTSEHQLGLAVDINADTEISASDDVYGWLLKNGHAYGFIKRYPSDKSPITGINNEPWHYRYVGREAAQEITKQGVCLEEYIESIQK